MDRASDVSAGAPPSTDAHVVHLVDDRQALVEAVTSYTRVALLHGAGVLVVATPEHRAALAAALSDGGLAVDRPTTRCRCSRRTARSAPADRSRRSPSGAGPLIG
jgi:hypothetical protein